MLTERLDLLYAVALCGTRRPLVAFSQDSSQDALSVVSVRFLPVL